MVYKTSINQPYERIGLFSAMLLTKQQYEHLELWKMSVEFADKFCSIAERLEKLQLNTFSKYVKDICMRISNHIAEISGNHDEQIIQRSLINAHLLILESENIIMILYEQQLMDAATKVSLLKKLQTLDDKMLDYQHQLEENQMFNFNNE